MRAVRLPLWSGPFGVSRWVLIASLILAPSAQARQKESPVKPPTLYRSIQIVLDAGHFALDTQADAIAELIRESVGSP